MRRLDSGTAGRAPLTKQQRQRRAQKVVDNYNRMGPKRAQKALRTLGVPDSAIRAIHRSAAPDPRTRPAPGTHPGRSLFGALDTAVAALTGEKPSHLPGDVLRGVGAGAHGLPHSKSPGRVKFTSGGKTYEARPSTGIIPFGGIGRGLGKGTLPEKVYKPRTLTHNELEQQLPKSRSRIARTVVEKPADLVSRRLQRSARARTMPGVRHATTEQRVAKAAGRSQRVEADRAHAGVAEHLRAISKVKKGSHEDVAHFWYAQLPARLRHAGGLGLIAAKQREHLAELTSGNFGKSLAAREKHLQAERSKLTFGTPEWSKVTNELERIDLARADLPRRIEDTSAGIAQLEQVAAKNPAVKTDVVKAIHALGSERRRILTDSKRLNPDKAAAREGLVSRWLGVEPTGEEAYIGHRAPKPRGGTMPTPTAGLGRVRSPKGVGTKNRLVLAETGRLRSSVHVAAEDWHHAQVFEQANVARGHLAKMGTPFQGHVPEGHVLVNPKGRTIPAHWKSDELSQFGEDWEDIAHVRKQAEEIAAGFVAKDPQAIEQLKLEADRAGIKRSELRVLCEDLAHRYYSQYRRMAPPRGTKLKALDGATDMVATSIIFARIGYIPKNVAQNVIMAIPHQGALLLRNVARAAQVLADRELRTRLRAEVGFSGASRELGSELSTGRKISGKIARFSGAVADDTLRTSAFLHEAAAAGVISKVSPLLNERDRQALMHLLTDESQRPLLNDIRSRSTEAMADFSRLTPDQARAARRFLVIPSWLMAGSRYPFHFAVNHPIRSALLAYIAAGEPGAPDKLHFNKPVNEYFKHGVAPWLDGIDVGGKTLRTGSLSPVSTPWELGNAALQTARGKSNQFDFAHPTAWDSAAPLASTAVDFFSGGGVKSLQRLVPGEKFVRQMIRPEESKYYLEDNTRLGRLKRELGVVPIETAAPRTVQGDYQAFHGELRTALKALGYDHIPKSLRGRLTLRQERAQARAKLGKNPSSEQKLAADVALLRKHGWIDDARAKRVLRWARTASKDDISHKGLRFLTTHYFDADGTLSESIRYVNARRQFEADIVLLHKLRRIDDRQLAGARKNARNASLDQLRGFLDHLPQEYDRYDFPEVPQLTLPNY